MTRLQPSLARPAGEPLPQEPDGKELASPAASAAEAASGTALTDLPDQLQEHIAASPPVQDLASLKNLSLALGRPRHFSIAYLILRVEVYQQLACAKDPTQVQAALRSIQTLRPDDQFDALQELAAHIQELPRSQRALAQAAFRSGLQELSPPLCPPAQIERLRVLSHLSAWTALEAGEPTERVTELYKFKRTPEVDALLLWTANHKAECAAIEAGESPPEVFNRFKLGKADHKMLYVRAALGPAAEAVREGLPPLQAMRQFQLFSHATAIPKYLLDRIALEQHALPALARGEKMLEVFLRCGFAHDCRSELQRRFELQRQSETKGGQAESCVDSVADSRSADQDELQRWADLGELGTPEPLARAAARLQPAADAALSDVSMSSTIASRS